jgi:DNA-binding NarL/FixJ family response regulator
MDRIRVLVADDHAILRAGLRMLINAQPDMQVCAEAESTSEAIRLTGECSPDVVVMDISMPGGLASESVESIRRGRPQTKVLVLTMHDDPAYLVAMMTAGASGYVLKRSAETELLSAIRAIHRGGSFLDPTVAGDVTQKAVRKKMAAHAGQPDRPPHLLSAREQEVLRRIAQGHTNQEIADLFSLSVKTIETHRARLVKKLGLSTRADLVRYARESGLLGAEKTH